MKSYIQGLITGGMFVFSFFVLIGASDKSDIKLLLENQQTIFEGLANHAKMLDSHAELFNIAHEAMKGLESNILGIKEYEDKRYTTIVDAMKELDNRLFDMFKEDRLRITKLEQE